jgi:HK97 family phage prohead protease
MTKKYNIRQAKRVQDDKVKTITCSVDWDTKSVTKDASGNIFIEGWANTVDKDRVGDVVLPSAFSKTMKEYMENPIMLYQHDWDKVAGNIVEYKIVDDENEPTNGLWIKAKVSNAKDVDDVRTKIKEGSLKTFSIGYNELDSDYDKATDTNIVKEIELLEISIVTIPCNPFAKFGMTADEEKKEDYSAAKVTPELLTFVSDALKELKDTSEISSDFLKEIIDIYNGEE